MKISSALKRTLLIVGMVASSSIAFAATSNFTVDAMANSNGGGSETGAMLLAGLGLMGTIARRRNRKQS